MANILIVDDEALVLLDLCMTVEQLGHTVVHDSTGIAAAMQYLDRGTPDAALLDIDVAGTPVWPLARALKERGCKIAFVSANSSHDELKHEFADCLFVDKPASRRDIAFALEGMLPDEAQAA